ncbi:hypothetical protein CBR_g19295 [Chara braunii]|uniref:Integrase catalytic domain-containing protein n=1 Tax=Chara braunii TaxID=69332 RepID=A0A388KXV7_CHABU|nr:hypothetical protein CBR_g19295 [Chara braunii]|eukprot:GBG74783.1 hypothetical protein CBR_g19295 [Chara braunii]
MQRRQADVSELEEVDLTLMSDDVRIIRSALLNIVEMQDHQTTILQDIQQSLALLAGRAQATSPMSGPGAWPVVHPPPYVPPVTGVSPYVAPSSVAIVSLGMLLSEGVSAGPLQVAVTTQPAVSQPVQPQGTQPQQLAQQPVSQGPQPGVMQGPGQTQWVPKTAIAAPKPFVGDKRGEDLDTWLRAVPIYVRCKLTLPHEEVLVAASYLEGSAARWLSGLVQLQGYGDDFRAWAVTQKLEDFLKMVEERWHDPQEAQRATDVILTLHTRQFKSVREATDAVERLIRVPGVRYDPQVLLTSYLRCFSLPLRNQLASQANINMHNFPSFSKMALDLEAKIGLGQAPTTNGRKKTLPPNWKAKGRLMFVDNDGSTIELDDNFQEGVGSEAGSVEASGGGVAAAVRRPVDAVEVPGLGVKLTPMLLHGRKRVLQRTCGEIVIHGRLVFVVANMAITSSSAAIRRYGPYEFVVMPFSLCNAPGTFQHAMNRIFHDYLDKYVIVYLDDILIFSKTVEEHVAHLDKVLSLLRQHKFKINGEKCALITEFGLEDSVTQSLVEAYREDPFMAEIIRRLEAKDKRTSAEFELINGLLFLVKAGNKRLCVPNSKFLRSLFLGECHDATGHFGFKKTAANLLQRFWWPTMMRDAKLYVETCQICQRDKPHTQAPLELLKPLPIPERPGESLSMDFMDTLVTSKSGMRYVYVIVDRFTAEQGTQLQMTSGNHPEANGQAEQLNRTVQHLLRHYIKPNQVDWDEKLALIASLYNNAVHSATGVSPNSLLVTFKPRLPLDFLLPDNQPSAAPGTLELAYRYEQLMQQAVEHMHKAQAAMIESENKHRRPSTFQVGERVWVKSSELGQEHRISRKLMPQYFGPWEILDVVGDEPDGPSYVIHIPGHLRTYPVFHASKLAPFKETDQFPSRHSMLPPTMDGEVDIDDIVDHRELPAPRPAGRGRPPRPKLQYRVRFWHHTDPKEDRWFTREELMQTAPQVSLHRNLRSGIYNWRSSIYNSRSGIYNSRSGIYNLLRHLQLAERSA